MILLVGCFYFFYKPGRHDLTAVSSPQDYALHLLENSLALRESSAPGIDPVSNAKGAYDIILRTIGESDLIRAAKALQSAAHDENGHLSQPMTILDSPVVLGYRDTKDPLFAFTALVTSYDDRGYAIGSYLGFYYPRYSELWKEAETAYETLVQRHGEKSVLAAAKRVRALPKLSNGIIMDNTTRKPLRAWVWIERLAADPGIRLPGE